MQFRFFRGMVAVVTVALSVQASGKSPQSSPNPSPNYRSITRAVAVDIVVEKGDDPVSGLHKQDFQVLEDGKPQAIDFFEDHTAETARPALQLPKMPAGVYSNLPAVAGNQSVNVLLLDALNTDQGDQVYVHNQIIEFLKNMPPGTRAAIFTLSSKLRMVQGFTTDSAALHAALNDPKYGVVPDKPMESRALDDKLADVRHIDSLLAVSNGSKEAVEALRSFQRDFASYQGDQRVSMTLDALQALARFLNGVPGRKNLIWFSSSFPLTVFPEPDQAHHPNRANRESLRMRETADLLYDSEIAVYPVSAEGVMSQHIAEADVSHMTDTEGQTILGAQKVCAECYLNESGARAEKMISMEQLAQETGGRTFFNTNDLAGATRKAITDGAHYYTLVYTPTNKKMDGGYRKIKVKVLDSGYRVEYRRGYYADDVPSGIEAKAEENPLRELMMYGMPNATQILFAARVLPVSPQPSQGSPRAGMNSNLTGSTTRYSVNFMIRSTDVKLENTPDGTHRGKLQIEIRAYDRTGNSVNWLGGTWDMTIKPDALAKLQKTGLLAHFEIDLPTHKNVYLETGVYDWETGKIGTLAIPILNEGAAPATR